MLKNIVIIGSGNLATNLANVFNNNGFVIKQVLSKHKKNAKLLAEKFNALYSNNPKEIIPDADIYIIAVSDNAITSVIDTINYKNIFVVHTSGSIEMDVLKKFKRYGVLYPLQTFSKNKISDFKSIPFLIESNSEKSTNNLKKLLKKTGVQNILNINSEKRQQIHLAAVFACNFTNYMYIIAQKILEKNDLPFTILQPLIKETADKIIKTLPLHVQTGPAIRNDFTVIKKHINMLDQFPVYKEIYNMITDSIINEDLK